MLLVSPPTFYYESFRNRKRKSRGHKACTLAARLVSSWSALLCRTATQLSPVHSHMRLKSCRPQSPGSLSTPACRPPLVCTQSLFFPWESTFITEEPYMSSVPPHPIRTEHIPLTSPEEAFLRQRVTSWPGLLACPALHTPSRLAAGSWEVSVWISCPILIAPPVF